jgi:TPR repeat protein
MKKTVIAFLLLVGLAYAGAYENGVKAYKNGNYKEAVKWFRKAVNQGGCRGTINPSKYVQ